MRALLAVSLLAAACQKAPSFQGTDEQLAEAVAKALTESCPLADPGDEKARSDCAVKLTDDDLLRDRLASPVLWGQQQAVDDYDLTSHFTRFHPLIWRRLYLSVYMFGGEHRVVKDGDVTRLHVTPAFRGKLDMGSYPYPFWHRPSKWAQYFLQKELIFFIKAGKIFAVRRSFDGTQGLFLQPPATPSVVHEWGGQWTWEVGGEQYPKAVLFSWLLSKDNPHRADLEEKYRDLEAAMRSTSCMACHSPDNVVNMAQLEILNYPNQALSARRRIVQSLENNTMPYPDALRGTTLGYHGDQEATRQKLLGLARAFEKAGDDALLYEGEQVP